MSTRHLIAYLLMVALVLGPLAIWYFHPNGYAKRRRRRARRAYRRE